MSTSTSMWTAVVAIHTHAIYDDDDAVCMWPNSGGQSTPLDNTYWEGGSEYCGIVSLLHNYTSQTSTQDM